MSQLREYMRHRVIGTPLDPVARGVRRQITRWQIRHHTVIRDAMLEDDLLHAIVDRTVRPGDHCVDIGAHLGAMTQRFLRLSPTGRHVCVEPTPYKAAWLARKFPDVTVVAAALAEEPGELTFYHQPRNSGYSGLTKHEANVNDTSDVQEIRVRCETLDAIVPEERRIAFMKIDVEGAELRVLRGAPRVLTRDRPMFVFECTETGLRSAGIEVGDLYDLLDGHAYTIHTPRAALEGGAALDRHGLDQAIRYPFAAFSFVATPR